MQNHTPAPLTSFAPPEFNATLRRYQRVLRRQWRVLGVTQLGCLLLAAAYLLVTRPLFEATARLLLIKQGGRALSVARDDGLRSLERSEDFLPTQMAVLQSPRVVGRAIESVGVARLPTLRAGSKTGTPEEMVQVAVKDYLKVTRPDRTASIVNVRYRAGSKGEAVAFVDALLASYYEFIKEHYQDSNSRVVSLLARARDDLGGEREGLQKQLLAFQREHPLLLEDESLRALNNSRLTELDRAANEATVKAMKLRSQLDIVKKLAKDGAEMWSVAYAIAQVGGDPAGTLIPRDSESGSGLASDYLRQLVREQQELTARYGPEYSKVRELQDLIVAAGQRVHESAGRLDKRGMGQLVASMERTLESVEALRAELTKKLSDGMEAAKQGAVVSTQGKTLRENLERQQAVFYTVVDQLKQAQLGGEFGGIDSETLEPATPVEKAVHPQTLWVLLGAVAVGGLTGFVAAMAADGLDSRVHSFEDLRNVPIAPVLGVIPMVGAGAASRAVAVGLISHTLPRSPSAEAYRVLRTGMEFLRKARRVQVVLVTSATAGEGKTTTASNLAISLANAGRKVLLVDADLRRPSLGRLYGGRTDVGLAEVLLDQASLSQAVQPTPVDGLELVAAGGPAANPAELLMSPRLGEVIADARGAYDFVVIDSSPLLPVTDPAVIGASADGILLVIRASGTRRQELSRAVELLRDVGTPVLGTVIAGSDDHFSGYRFGYGAYGDPDPSQARGGLAARTPAEVVRSFVLEVGNDPRISANLDGTNHHPPGDRAASPRGLRAGTDS